MPKRRFSVLNYFRRKTPTPQDRKVFNLGIQERQDSYFMTAPIVFHVASQSVILRTCTTQLKNEIFRRGFFWEKVFDSKCKDCEKEHKSPVAECSSCGSKNLQKPNETQLKYAKSFLDGNVNTSEQMFIDILKEMEDDLNIIDDAYLIMVKEYFLDGNGDIKLHKIRR